VFPEPGTCSDDRARVGFVDLDTDLRDHDDGGEHLHYGIDDPDDDNESA